MKTKKIRVKLYFNTRQYEFSHGKQPRGYGSWAFDFGTGPVFAPTSTYAEAKKWASEYAQKFANPTVVTIECEVCS